MIFKGNVISVALATCLAILSSCSDDGPEKGPSKADANSVDAFANFDVSSDGSTGTDSAQPDIVPDPGTFLAPCTKNDDCDSGLCIESAAGKVCTKTCSDDCPAGFSCRQKAGGTGDVVFLCTPRFLFLCNPCNDNKDCNESGKSDAVCANVGKHGEEEGMFCTARCDPDVKNDCPGGYACKEMVGHGFQCIRVDGNCPCSKTAAKLGLKTTCSKHKDIGDSGKFCVGERHCSTKGLSECSAKVPAIDECNYLDDDCDGTTDNLDPALKVECINKNEHGLCKGTVTGCSDGKSICSAKSPKPEVCNGLDDNCDGVTDENLCDDGKVCTSDKCKGNTCNHEPDDSLKCDDGSICSKTDKCLSGVCVGASKLDCDDQDPCSTDSCDPLKGCKHAPASSATCPDDGNVCTQDVCKEGKCIHPEKKEGSVCADDGVLCTDDICKSSKCIHPLNTGKKCASDGKQCTNDICQKGQCEHTNRSGSCSDGNPCTTKDNCQKDKCVGGPWNECDDKNPCTKDSCIDGKGCKHEAADLLACTLKSGPCTQGVCSKGKCQAKPDVACSTKITVDKCGKLDANGTCTSKGKCVAKSSSSEVKCSNSCSGMCFKCSGKEICWTP